MELQYSCCLDKILIVCWLDVVIGVGGYNWGKYVNGTSNGFWYHASHAHSMVTFGNSTTGPNGMQWTPRGDCKPAGNCTTSLYGLRGPAWVDSTTFTDAVHWVVSVQREPVSPLFDAAAHEQVLIQNSCVP